MGFSLINQPFWDTPIYGNPQVTRNWLKDSESHGQYLGSSRKTSDFSLVKYNSARMLGAPETPGEIGQVKGWNSGALMIIDITI